MNIHLLTLRYAFMAFLPAPPRSSFSNSSVFPCNSAIFDVTMLFPSPTVGLGSEEVVLVAFRPQASIGSK